MTFMSDGTHRIAMWPWGHLAVGYLLYALYHRRIGGTAPTGQATIALAVGTQFPDLVDKPFTWFVALLPAGRSLAHSLLTALVVLTVIVLLSERFRGNGPARAFAFGYLSHLGLDTLDPIIFANHDSLGFILWPLLPLATTPLVPHDPVTFRLWVGYGLVQTAVAGIAVRAWYRDGRPGLQVIVPTRQ